MNTKKILGLVLVFIVEIALFAGGLNFINLYTGKIHAVHNELLAWQQKDEALRLLQETYYQNKTEIDLIHQSLPPGVSIIPFFEELENVASKSGVLLTIDMNTQPEEDVQRSLLTVLLRLSVDGSFGQINNFVNNLEALEQLIVVRQVVLQAPDGFANKVKGTILIKAFFAK